MLGLFRRKPKRQALPSWLVYSIPNGWLIFMCTACEMDTFYVCKYCREYVCFDCVCAGVHHCQGKDGQRR